LSQIFGYYFSDLAPNKDPVLDMIKGLLEATR
jgi:hypothetical protein